jgi:glutamate synthase domain-containing protein 3
LLLDAIEDFTVRTHSAWSQAILEDFENYLPRFRVVKPQSLALSSLVAPTETAA